MKASWKKLVVDALIVVVLFAAGFAFLSYKIWVGFNRYDEGAHLYLAWMIGVHGYIPFLDLHHIYPPGRFYAIAWGAKLFGWDLLHFRYASAFFSSLNGVLIYLFAARLSRRWCGMVTWALSLVYFFEFADPAIMMLVFFLCAGYFKAPNIVKVFIAGLLIGFVTWCRQDFGFYACVAAIPAFLLWSWTRGEGKSFIRRFLPAMEGLSFMALGVVVFLTPWAILYLAVAREEFVYSFITAPLMTTNLRALPYPGPMGPLGAFAAGAMPFAVYAREVVTSAWPYYTPFLIVGFSVLFLWLRRGGLSRFTNWDFAHVYAAVFALTFFSYVRIVTNLWHLVPLALFATVLTGPLLMDTVDLFKKRRRCLPALGATVLVIVVGTGAVIVFMKLKNLRLLDRQYVALNIPRAKGIKIEPNLAADYQDAIAYIQSRTKPSERVFVSTIRHDVVAANDILFPFLSDRMLSTRFFHYDPGVQTTAEVQEHMIWELKVHKVRYAVLWLFFPDETLIKKNLEMGGSTLLDKYLQEHFKTEVEFGEYFILRRTKW